MTKYSIEVKQELIELIEKKNHSIIGAARELGVSSSVAKRWVQMFRNNGYEGLSKKKGTYSGKYKVGVVEYMHKNHFSISEASARFGIPSASTLLKWERIYYEEGVEGLMNEKRGRPRKDTNKKTTLPKMNKSVEEDLISQVQWLKAENAYLKKYNALVQEEMDLENLRKRR